MPTRGKCHQNKWLCKENLQVCLLCITQLHSCSNFWIPTTKHINLTHNLTTYLTLARPLWVQWEGHNAGLHGPFERTLLNHMKRGKQKKPKKIATDQSTDNREEGYARRDFVTDNWSVDWRDGHGGLEEAEGVTIHQWLGVNECQLWQLQETASRRKGLSHSLTDSPVQQLWI